MWNKKPILFLSLLTFGIYFFSFFNQFVWDDEQFIYRNQFVQNFLVDKIFTTNTVEGAGEISNYYRPLTTLSFAVDYQFWGTNPFFYHIENTLLHLATGILLYKLLQKLRFDARISFITALLFLIHPLQTEAVTYVNSRGDSLYSFFLMLSLWLLTHLFEKKKYAFTLYEQKFELSQYLLAVLTILTYSAAILSKEIALAGLGLHGLVIARYYFLKPDHLKKFLSEHILPIFSFAGNAVTVLIYLGLRSSILNFQNTFNFFDDTSIYSESITVRLLTFFKIMFIYLKLFFFPFPLHMERTTDIITTPFNFWLLAFSILIASMIFICHWQWKKKKETTILFGWAWSAVMLVPVSGIVAINGLLYEHWLYLPLIGFSIICYETIKLLWPQLLTTHFYKYAFMAIVAVLCLLTIRQNYFWSTPVRLYTYLLQHTESGRIHNNLAMAYSEEGEYEKAISHYQQGLAYGIEYPQIYHNLGNTYVAVGDLDNAQLSYEKALELQPSFFHSYPNLIRLYIEKNNFESALKVAYLAQQSYPQNLDYQILELQILAVANNKEGFENKKAQMLKSYKDQPEVLIYLEKLQFSQE